MHWISKKSSGPINALFAAVLTVGLFYMAQYVTLARLFLFFPFVTLLAAEGWGWTGLSMGGCVLVASLLVGPKQALLEALIVLPAACAMGLAIRKKLAPVHEILLTSLVLFACALLQLYFVSRASGTPIFSEIESQVQSTISSQWKEILNHMAEADQPSLEYQFSLAMDVLLHAIPGLLYVSGLLTALLTGLISHMALRGQGVVPMALADFNLPRPLVLVLVGLPAALLLLFPDRLSNSSFFLVSLFLLVFNGLGFLDARFQKRMIHWLGRLILYALISFLVLPLPFFLFLGLADGLGQFRTRMRERG